MTNYRVRGQVWDNGTLALFNFSEADPEDLQARLDRSDIALSCDVTFEIEANGRLIAWCATMIAEVLQWAPGNSSIPRLVASPPETNVDKAPMSRVRDKAPMSRVRQADVDEV